MVKTEKPALTQERLKEILSYNPVTGEFTWITRASKHNTNKIGKVAGSLHKSTGYLRVCIDGTTYLMHRLVWLYVHGNFPKGDKNQIDHIDGDRVNNKLVNLKVCSIAENQRNQKMTIRNTSGVTGVSLSEKKRKQGIIDRYWVAEWRDVHGKTRKKSFLISQLGEEQAKELATKHRAEQIRLLELNHNVKYSERHGK